ncbi:hypothetical protein [Amycolatopsis sp. cmx-11-51]|uniref:hypothetical protein n=1 Tax=Amycolatopsis sp. cmx-11-51 TaxID=2785797 RepID=UPI0039E24CC9
MSPWWKHSSEERPPLAGRLLGLALSLVVFSAAVYILVSTVRLAAALVAGLLPLLVVAGIYWAVLSRIRKK